MRVQRRYILVVTTRAYEIMIIVDGDEEDAKVDEIVQDVDAWIQGQNGQIAKTDKSVSYTHLTLPTTPYV